MTIGVYSADCGAGMKIRRATKKDLEKCLRLMRKWGEKRLDGVGWGVAGELCNCKEHKGVYAHLDYDSRAHTALLRLHQVDNVECTALHEQLHLEMAPMHRVVQELQWGGITEKQRGQAYKWYFYYEDDFIDQVTKTLLGMDKELRCWKRKAKKLEKQLCE